MHRVRQHLARCRRRPIQPGRPVWGAPVAGVMWPTVEGRATPRRRPQSKQVPPPRPRGAAANNVSGLLIGACVLRATMDISAHGFLLAARPLLGQTGHQFSHAPGRPILHLVSISRRPRQETGCNVMSSLAPYRCSSFVRVHGSFLRPCVQLRSGAARRGRQGWPSRWARIGRRRFRPADGSEHGATLQADRDAIVFVLVHSNLCSLLRNAMRASLLASAIARTFGCSRFLAASIQGLSPWRSQVVGFTSTTQAACTNRTRRYQLLCFEILTRIVRSPATFAWAPTRARRRSRAPSRTPRHCRSRPPSRSR